MTNLPNELKSAEALYTFLGVGSDEAKFLVKYSAYRYTQAFIPKRRGGLRTLLVPERRLKFLQRRTLTLLEQLHSPRVTVHGFVKDRSPITNANQHQKRPYLLNLDLLNFFGTIRRRRILGVLKALGLGEGVALALCSICVVKDQLPQGAPTSPILSNMIAYRLDLALLDFAKKNRLRYTRYADDLTLSSYVEPTALFDGLMPAPGKVPIDRISPFLRLAINANGFDLNHDKIWFSGPRSRKEVTGLVVNEFTNVRRDFVRNVRAALYKVEKVGIVAAEKEYQGKYKTDASLEQIIRGRLEWIAQVRGRSFSAYRTLAKRFNKQFPGSMLTILPTYGEIAERAVWVLDVFVDGDCEQGTAFFLEGVGLVTAYHVVEKLEAGGCATLYRPSEPTKEFSATLSEVKCAQRDLAILNHDVPAEEYFSLPVVTSPEHTKDDIAALGFPDFGPGDQLSKIRGHLTGRATKHGVKFIVVSAILPGGISGGPIINDRYQVIGIAHRGGSQESKQLAVEISELLSLAAE
jgi:RNA-directed DNA polymerase